MPTTTGNDLKQQLERAKRGFSTFVTAREDWDKVIAREWPTVLPPTLVDRQQGLDYQTPDGERAIMDMVDVLMNPTIFRVDPLDPGPRTERYSTDIAA